MFSVYFPIYFLTSFPFPLILYYGFGLLLWWGPAYKPCYLGFSFVGNLAALGMISYRSEDLCGYRERGGLLGTRVKGVI